MWAKAHDLWCVTNGSLWLQVERRCAIDHELAHIELGHTCGWFGPLELAARRRSATRLVRIADLIARWTTDVSEVADMLWVTEDLLATRMKCLSDDERHQLLGAAGHHREEQQ